MEEILVSLARALFSGKKSKSEVLATLGIVVVVLTIMGLYIWTLFN